MKWCDLSHVGCELYIHAESIDERNPETGLPDFRIKVIDEKLYAKSLTSLENGLMFHGYELVEGERNLYRRTKKETLGAAEFIDVFGKDNIHPGILVEKNPSEFVFQGHIVDLTDAGVDFNLVRFEGEVRDSLVAEISSTSLVARSTNMADLLTSVSEEMIYTGEGVLDYPNKKNYDGRYYQNEDLTGKSDTAFVSIRGIKEGAVKSFSNALEVAVLNSGNDDVASVVRYKPYKPGKYISQSKLNSIVKELDRTMAQDSVFKSIQSSREAINEAFADFSSRKGLDFEQKFYTVKEFGGTLEALKKRNLPLYEGLIEKLTSHLKGSPDFFRPDMISNQFLNTDELHFLVNSKSQLLELFGEDVAENIIEVDVDNLDNRLILATSNNLALYSRINNPIERAVYSAYGEGNDLRMKLVFDHAWSLRSQLQIQTNYALSALDENSEGIVSAFEKIKSLTSEIVQFQDILENSLAADEEMPSFEYAINVLRPYGLKTDVQKVEVIYQKHLELKDQARLEEERKQREAEIAAQRKEALEAITQFTESEKAKSAGKRERIEDFGEKIGGAVKDDYRWLNSNIARLSFEEYREKLELLDDADIQRIAKKTNIVESFDPISLKEEGVTPAVAYAIKILMNALPATPEKAGLPAKHYIHLIKKVNDVLYRHKYAQGLNAFVEAVQKDIETEVMFEHITNNKSYYYTPDVSAKFFTDSLHFETLESLILSVDNESKTGAIADKFKALGRDSLTEKEKVVFDQVYHISNEIVTRKSWIGGFYEEWTKSIQQGLGERFIKDLITRPYGFREKIRNATYGESWSRMITNKMIQARLKGDGNQDQESDNENVTEQDKSESQLDTLNPLEKKVQSLSEEVKAAVKIDSSDIKHLGHVVREGEDYGVSELNERVFAHYFGFRAVEFGEWLPQKERKEVLKHAFNAFMDLSKSLRITPEQISLGGNLAMAFGSRGRSSALAHFEPDRNVINLTRMKGAGSLAHEFGHAMDKFIVNYLADKYPEFNVLSRGREFISKLILENTESKKKKVRFDESLIGYMRNAISDSEDLAMFNAYVDLHKALYKKQSSFESDLERNINMKMFEKGYAPTLLKNVFTHLYYRLKSTASSHFDQFKDEEGNIPNDKQQEKDKYSRFLYESIYKATIGNKDFETFMSVIAPHYAFPLKAFDNEIKTYFDDLEARIDSGEVSLNKEQLKKSIIEITDEPMTQIKVKHTENTIREIEKLASRFINPIPSFLLEKEIEPTMVYIDKTSGVTVLSDIYQDRLSELSNIENDGGEKRQAYIDRMKPVEIQSKLINVLSQDKDLMEFLFATVSGRKGFVGYLDEQFNYIMSSYETRMYHRVLIKDNNNLKSFQEIGETRTPGHERTVIDTSFYEHATKLDKSKHYYRESVEMFARSFESYVLDRINENDEQSDYLVSSGKAPGKQNPDCSRYPLGLERKSINEKMDNFIQAYNRVMDSQLSQEEIGRLQV
jgi:hypothetical protein